MNNIVIVHAGTCDYELTSIVEHLCSKHCMYLSSRAPLKITEGWDVVFVLSFSPLAIMRRLISGVWELLHWNWLLGQHLTPNSLQ